MSKIVMVTGGAKSGKSTFAESLIKEASKCGDTVIYLATATVCDEEMEDRVAKHKAERPGDWLTVEKFQDFKDINYIMDETKAEYILLDCMGFMLNNIIFHSNIDFNSGTPKEYEKIEKKMLNELETVCSIVTKKNAMLVVVTNEVGMGLVPGDRMSRYYRDILGRANRFMAVASDEVYCVFSGIPLKIKESNK